MKAVPVLVLFLGIALGCGSFVGGDEPEIDLPPQPTLPQSAPDSQPTTGTSPPPIPASNDAATPTQPVWAAGSAPVYVMPYSHHYNGSGGYYASAEEIRDIAESCESMGLVNECTLFFDGIQIARLSASDPEFLSWVKETGFPIGYHGEDVHGPYPIVASLDAMVSGTPQDQLVLQTDSFSQAASRVHDRYSHGFESMELRADNYINRMVRSPNSSTARGGLALVSDTLGRVSVLTGHSLYLPPAHTAFSDITDFALMQDAGPYAHHFAMKLENPELTQALDNFLGGDTAAFWYMGRMGLKGQSWSSLPHWEQGPKGAQSGKSGKSGKAGKSGGKAGKGGKSGAVTPPANGTDFRETFESNPRTAPWVVSFNMHGSGTTNLEALQYVKGFLDANPGSQFVSPDTLAQLVAAPEVTLSGDAVSSAVLSSWDGGPSDVVIVQGITISLADAFEVLVYGLAGQAAVTTTNLLGPIGHPSDLVEATGSVTADDVRAAAATVVSSIESSTHHSMPLNVVVGNTTVGFHQYFYLAAAVSNGEAGPLTVPQARYSPPFADVLVRNFDRNLPNADFWTRCQYWTIKPVAWLGQ